MLVQEFRELTADELTTVADIFGMKPPDIDFIVVYDREGDPQHILYSPFYEKPTQGPEGTEPAGYIRSVTTVAKCNSTGCQMGYRRVERVTSDGSVSVQCRKC